MPESNEIKKQQTIQLAKLVEGEIFGADEILNHGTSFRLRRKYSAICNSFDAKVYYAPWLALKSAFQDSEILQDLLQKNLIHQKNFFQDREKEIIKSLINTAQFRIQLPSLSKRSLLYQDSSMASNISLTSRSQIEPPNLSNLIKKSIHDFAKKKKNLDNSLDQQNSFDSNTDQQKDHDSPPIMIIPELQLKKQRTITLPTSLHHHHSKPSLFQLPQISKIPKDQASCQRLCCSLNKEQNEQIHSRIINMHKLSKQILQAQNQIQALKKLPIGSELDSSPYFQQSENIQKIMKFINKNYGIMFPKERDQELKNQEDLNSATQMFQALKQIDNHGNFQDQSIKLVILCLFFKQDNKFHWLNKNTHIIVIKSQLKLQQLVVALIIINKSKAFRH